MNQKSRKVLIGKFRKLFRNSLCKILKEHKLSADHIIYEEESNENSIDEEDEDEQGGYRSPREPN